MNCPFSNLYPSPFYTNDGGFSCNEQFYYYCKACNGKDDNAKMNIMANDDPAQTKRGSDSDWSESNEAVQAVHIWVWDWTQRIPNVHVGRPM